METVPCQLPKPGAPNEFWGLKPAFAVNLHIFGNGGYYTDHSEAKWDFQDTSRQAQTRESAKWLPDVLAWIPLTDCRQQLAPDGLLIDPPLPAAMAPSLRQSHAFTIRDTLNTSCTSFRYPQVGTLHVTLFSLSTHHISIKTLLSR